MSITETRREGLRFACLRCIRAGKAKVAEKRQKFDKGCSICGTKTWCHLVEGEVAESIHLKKPEIDDAIEIEEAKQKAIEELVAEDVEETPEEKKARLKAELAELG